MPPMRIRSPSLHELHAFAATARLGSFSRAADELCVTQGAVSRAVARLEEHLGLALLVRRGRYSELTEAGREYLESVEPALATLESASGALMSRAGGGKRGHALRLSVPPTLFSHWLIPRLPDFQARHPEVTLSFAPYRRDDPLDAPDVDAWVRIGDGSHWPRGIEGQYIVGREIVPICRPQDLPQIQAPADLLQRPLLFHTHYPGNWQRWFEGVGCPTGELEAAADFELVGLLVQAVAAGLGVAVVQRCLIEADLAGGRVAIAVPQSVEIERGYHLCWPGARPAGRALEAFRRWLGGQGAA